MYELVIFDCDGVLVDSERISCGLLADALSDLGLEMNLERAVDLFMGRSARDSLRISAELLGAPLPTGFREELDARKFQAFRERLKPVSGTVEALEWIVSELPRVRICVASSGTHERMGVTLGVTQLNRYFGENIFSSTEAENGKPAPDLFLHAARTMGVETNKAVVVEDSVPGTQAGIAAGMTVFGYSDLVPAERLQAVGARTFSRMEDLPRLLTRA